MKRETLHWKPKKLQNSKRPKCSVQSNFSARQRLRLFNKTIYFKQQREKQAFKKLIVHVIIHYLHYIQLAVKMKWLVALCDNRLNIEAPAVR